MAYDDPQPPPQPFGAAPVAPPPPAPAPSQPMNFALGAPSRGPKVPGKPLAVVAAVAVLAGGGYVAYGKLAGGSDSTLKPVANPAPKKPVATKPALLTDPQKVKSIVKNLATAEESYALDHDGRYTPRLADLENEYGGKFTQGVRAVVKTPTPTSYCVGAIGGGSVRFFLRSIGPLSTRPC